MGQYFTPHSVSSLLAQLAAGDLLAQLKSCPFISLQEPTSGAGGMVIAFAEIMLQAGLNPATQLLVTTIDIDPLAADMTFVQLSLLGIPATVNTGNTLTLQMNLTRHTPVWFFNDWQERIRSHERIQAMRAFMSRLC
jgi:type I restriction-modification system DNA methylase subunit